MKPAKVISAGIWGIEAIPIEVEADISDGLPSFNIVGLPDKAVEEAKERVKAAIKNSPFKFPTQKITVNLAPADIPKIGTIYDLPIAIAILIASGQIPPLLKKILILGELALGGQLRRIRGVFPMVELAEKKSFEEIIVPLSNAKEGISKKTQIKGAENLFDVALYLRGEKELSVFNSKINPEEFLDFENDFSYIKGQEVAKRALEIAAAGGHNVLMVGPPGVGKTLLARSFPSILPPLNFEEILEVNRIYSVAGFLREKILTSRPFRTPHHTDSVVSIVGGGRIPRPGEISLAHRGVLFLDEFAEFPRSIIEALRQPLEDGQITVARASFSFNFPAKFTLIAAQNPCPCGYFGDKERECRCSPSQIIKYQQKISGPILDRIDITLYLGRVDFEKLESKDDQKTSSQIRKKVEMAREIQSKRFEKEKIFTNSEMKPNLIKKYCQIDETSYQLLKNAVEKFHLSPRSYHKILKLARTIADLENSANLNKEHIGEAIQYQRYFHLDRF